MPLGSAMRPSRTVTPFMKRSAPQQLPFQPNGSSGRQSAFTGTFSRVM